MNGPMSPASGFPCGNPVAARSARISSGRSGPPRNFFEYDWIAVTAPAVSAEADEVPEYRGV